MSSNLVLSNITSERYALALYELVKEKSELNNAEIEANGLKQLLLLSPEFKNLVSNPTISKTEQGKAVSSVLEHFNFSQTFKKFLGFLVFKGRLFFLSKIIENFINLISKNKGEMIAKFVSSKKLSDSDINIIQEDLSQHFKSKIKIDYKHDPNLIGGLILQVGSIMIDTSLKSKLKRLEQSMLEV